METVISFSQLIGMGFKIYGWLIVAAFVLSWLDADPTNGAVQFVNRTTRPFWGWIANRLPGQYASYAPLVAMFAVDFAEIFFPGLVRSLGSVGLGIAAMDAGMFNTLLYAGLGVLVVGRSILFFVMILALAYLVISIVAPPLTNPLVRNIIWLVDPIISPLQKILPRSKIDFSPIVLSFTIYMVLQSISPMAAKLQIQLIA